MQVPSPGQDTARRPVKGDPATLGLGWIDQPESRGCAPATPPASPNAISAPAATSPILETNLRLSMFDPPFRACDPDGPQRRWRYGRRAARDCPPPFQKGQRGFLRWDLDGSRSCALVRPVPIAREIALFLGRSRATCSP